MREKMFLPVAALPGGIPVHHPPPPAGRQVFIGSVWGGYIFVDLTVQISCFVTI